MKQLAEQKAPSLKAFALMVGVPYRTLQNYVAETREPQAAVLSQICTQSGVNGHWLLTGQGPMHRPPQDAAPAAIADTRGPYLTTAAPALDAVCAQLLDAAQDAPDLALLLHDLADLVGDCDGAPRLPQALGFLAWYARWWWSATDDERTWAEVQLRRALPEYAEQISARTNHTD